MSKVVWIVGLAVALVACGDDSTDDGGGTGGMAAGAGGAMGCPVQQNPVTACDAPCAAAAATPPLCAVNCCTADNKCGTTNAATQATAGGACVEITGRDDSSCPDEMILTQMVEGCCTADMITCGVVDTLTGMGCVARASVPLASLSPVNCDGTTPTLADGGM